MMFIDNNNKYGIPDPPLMFIDDEPEDRPRPLLPLPEDRPRDLPPLPEDRPRPRSAYSNALGSRRVDFPLGLPHSFVFSLGSLYIICSGCNCSNKIRDTD